MAEEDRADDVEDKFKFPYTPTNPSGGTAIQVGCNGGKQIQEDEHVVPPGVLVFHPDNATVGRGLNKVPRGDVKQGKHVIGVSMDGIIDPIAAHKSPESAGRYSVAVSGSVTLTAAIPDGKGGLKMPDLLSTLYVDMKGPSKFVATTPTGQKYYMPKFNTDHTGKKVGVVHWVNNNFSSDKIAEVRVHLNVF